MNQKIGLRFPFFTLLIFALIFNPFAKLRGLEFHHAWQFLLFSPQMFFLLATILILFIKKIPSQQIGLTCDSLTKNILLGIGLGVIPYFLLAAVNALIGHWQQVPADNTPVFQWNHWMLFSLFVFAPIAEELFFRGIVFHALNESYSLLISVIASSLLFMASHSSLMIGPFLLGIIAALLTKKAKSLVPGIIFHSLSNGLMFFYINHCSNLFPFEKWLFFRF